MLLTYTHHTEVNSKTLESLLDQYYLLTGKFSRRDISLLVVLLLTLFPPPTTATSNGGGGGGGSSSNAPSRLGNSDLSLTSSLPHHQDQQQQQLHHHLSSPAEQALVLSMLGRISTSFASIDSNTTSQLACERLRQLDLPLAEHVDRLLLLSHHQQQGQQEGGLAAAASSATLGSGVLEPQQGGGKDHPYQQQQSMGQRGKDPPPHHHHQGLTSLRALFKYWMDDVLVGLLRQSPLFFLWDACVVLPPSALSPSHGLAGERGGGKGLGGRSREEEGGGGGGENMMRRMWRWNHEEMVACCVDIIQLLREVGRWID